MKKYIYESLSEKEINTLCSRQNLNSEQVNIIVKEIELNVIKN